MAYIKGKIFKEIYVNPENGYRVGLIKVIDTDEKYYLDRTVTFTGTFLEIKPRTNYLLSGKFIDHAKYGKQFQVDSYDLAEPTDEEELIEFFSSPMFPIGKITAERIVKKLGVHAIDKIIKDERALSGITRLNTKNAHIIYERLKEYKNNSYVILELKKMGFSIKNALAILKKYGDQTKKIIDLNLYSLINNKEIFFSEIDRMALSHGYGYNDERRILALTIYVMNEKTFDQGDTYLYFDELYTDLVRKTDNLKEEDFRSILKKLDEEHKIVIKDDRYYLKEFYEAEDYIANRLYRLNEFKKRKLPQLEHLIDKLEKVNGIKYDQGQRKAIKKSLNNNLTIITGGPGTGKTTIIKCIVKLLMDIDGFKKSQLALLAPTGRASKKLSDVTGAPAWTIHKYLKWDKDRNEFAINEYCPNKEKYIIIDEASMIDTLLMSSLLKGITPRAKIILVGDYHQLPSVSQGQVLKDLIDSECIDVVKLNCLYRQTKDSYITTLAKEIKNKEVKDNFLEKYDDYNFIQRPNSSILDNVEDIVKKALEKGYTNNDIQVLAPMYRGMNGIDNLNRVLQKIMNPPSFDKNEIISGEVIYREGDKVLQLVNDNDNGISNGDLGFIETITCKDLNEYEEDEIVINFFGNEVTYTKKDLKNITHGYAISVHKSQGGEFKMVIMPILKAFQRMLYNKLIYTAITRAKEKLILIGDPQAFTSGILNDYVEKRKTGLREKIENKYNITEYINNNDG